MKSKIITIPNILSAFRLCLIPLFMWLYISRQEYIWTGLILILSGATDVVDGFIARHFNMVSDLGKILDPIADKLTQMAMLFCLITRFPLMLAPLILLVSKELVTAVTGILVVRKTKSVYSAKWHGKAATCMLYAMMILHVFWYDISKTVSDLSILVCIIMMLISFVLYVSGNIKALREKVQVK